MPKVTLHDPGRTWIGSPFEDMSTIWPPSRAHCGPEVRVRTLVAGPVGRVAGDEVQRADPLSVPRSVRPA